MGGPEGVERQHRNGKLTVRERLAAAGRPGLVPRSSPACAARARYDDAGELVGVLPDGKVEGMCRIDGRKVVVTAGDFTVRGGSASGHTGGLGRRSSPPPSGRSNGGCRYVRLLDAAGGSVRSFESLGRTYLPDANSFTHVDVKLLNTAPVVSAVLGAAAGIGALHTSLAHWNVMVRDTGQVFPGGPPVVKAALGDDITKEDLGGWHIHTRVSGVVDNLADDEEDAFRQIRRFLSYLPSSVDEMAPRGEAARSGRPPRGRAGSTSCREIRARGARRPAPDRAGRRRGLVLPDRAAATAGPGSPGWRASTATRSG